MGNFTIKKPEEEYIPLGPHQGVKFTIPPNLLISILNSYILNNLTKSPNYDEENIKKGKESLSKWKEAKEKEKK